MCRIVGFLDSNTNNPEREVMIKEMRDTLSYGGPNDAGYYLDDKIALGHRRLSILDLSEAGKQPMLWNNYVITYNGEVYNFKEIQEELKKCGYSFDTETDTEVILKAFHKWGKNCVNKFRGMFAFAIWDKQNKKLTLCRDRVGVKPLFWYKKDDVFMFASELKAFHKYPNFDKTIDKKAVGLFLQQGYIHSPYSIYAHVKKLKPGTFLELNEKKDITVHSYWNIDEINASSKMNTKKEGVVLEELENILLNSFKLRMVSDVPVGMFLSGGIDSSLVTAMLQKESNTPINTFTIGFQDNTKNEAPFANAVANHIGSNHTELICNEENFMEIVRQLPDFYDEPFGDSSAIPTYLVSKLAKKTVTVSLSADGGDELFGGYTKYEISKKIYSKISRIPMPIKSILSNSLGKIDPRWLEKNSSWLPMLRGYKDVGNKFSKFQSAVNSNSLLSFFDASSSYISASEIGKYTHDFYNKYELLKHTKEKKGNIISFLGMLDIKTYLEGDILTKVDRATMQVSLEGREPFLDHKIIEFSQTIPDELKIKHGQTKYLLRKILYKYVPKNLIERPKQGFSIPIKDWLISYLKDDLRILCSDLDFFDSLSLNREHIEKKINSFLNQTEYVNPHIVWYIFILHQWYKKWN